MPKPVTFEVLKNSSLDGLVATFNTLLQLFRKDVIDMALSV
jgi:hypothetical protein